MRYTIAIDGGSFATEALDIAESVIRSPNICGYHPDAQERCSVLQKVPRGAIARLLSMHARHENGRNISVTIPRAGVTVQIESTTNAHRCMFG
ncbi:hypothetical protein COU80_02330 [Candidatus Peregrinibacteria bacterium CG10_big_fil_rev_8_21_14_0_10_55_24]|nr:MAG: hypothetical protein COU80_02330 [Candidatus Peregrinibacteria bacterium CG10_big_fil_rev_8_21_14_0_10_55_24]